MISVAPSEAELAAGTFTDAAAPFWDGGRNGTKSAVLIRRDSPSARSLSALSSRRQSPVLPSR